MNTKGKLERTQTSIEQTQVTNELIVAWQNLPVVSSI